SWQWDEVHFRVLGPVHPGAAHDNDNSCVLLIEGRGGRILLTGDISSRVEPDVVAALGKGRAPILLMPHHGSKSSSSAPFISALKPPFAVVSAGWRNRFGHPRPEVLARYAEAGVPVFNTAQEGAMALDFPVDGPPRREPGWRQRKRRYWRE
ncbi:MAG: DNA internalization-related competence protein ComEC/Rec2, partial [Rhodanobacter sp.]